MSGIPPNQDDRSILSGLLGQRTCSDGPVTKFTWYFGLAILLTILFWITVTYVNSTPVRLLLFFIGALILDYLFTLWRNSHIICK